MYKDFADVVIKTLIIKSEKSNLKCSSRYQDDLSLVKFECSRYEIWDILYVIAEV